MPDKQKRVPEMGQKRVALTARLSLEAYHAITDLQRQHRIKTGRSLPIWKVIDTAVRAYAKRQGIKVGE